MMGGFSFILHFELFEKKVKFCKDLWIFQIILNIV
jgi:hypothetical protein